MDNLPSHVAIIMDGNGRWAKLKGKPRTFGHAKGTEQVRDIAIAASKKGIKYLTVYAFSTENWIRPKEEVNYIMKLPGLFFDRFINDLMKHNIKATMIGEKDLLPKETIEVLDNAFNKTSNNTGMQLIFAFNYGSRRELLLSFKEILKEGINADELTEEMISNHLMTKDIPDVDLLIRTSGEVRLSNFLLWQLAYSEMVFTDTLWPDFSIEEFYSIIDEYSNRDRRYGGLK